MTSSDIASSIRRNTGSAAVAALCLIFFGFFGFFAIPKITDLFTLGDAVFNYTLRGGGVLMAVVAVWSYCGRATALLADAFASTAIGIMLILSGVLMIVGSGGVTLNYVLYIVFGAMFISAGVRNWREYVELTRWSVSDASDHAAPGGSAQALQRREPPGSPPGPSLASQLRHRMAGAPGRGTDTLAESPDTRPLRSALSYENAESSRDAGSTPPPTDEVDRGDASSGERLAKRDGEPPPDGYLASFADDGPAPKG